MLIRFCFLALGAVVSSALVASPTVRVSRGGFAGSGGHAVVLRGVSWFGMETETKAPHGLWKRKYKDMLRQVRDLGFNTIRLPFSNAALAKGAIVSGIDEWKNPDLAGRSPLEVLDLIVREADNLGLWIVLDRHRPQPTAQSELWFTDDVPEAKWIDDWVGLARRYRHERAVIGFDLHNEPHGKATWGSNDEATDWRLAAERAGQAILAVHPDLLLFVQGIENTRVGSYWWGGNLSEAADAPVRLPVEDRLVYVAHDYPASVHPQPWLSATDFPGNLVGIWEKFWALPALVGTVPVLLGEFGTKWATEADRRWFDTVVDFLVARRMSFLFWSLNPNSADTGGLLQEDWTTVNEGKWAVLKRAVQP